MFDVIRLSQTVNWEAFKKKTCDVFEILFLHSQYNAWRRPLEYRSGWSIILQQFGPIL